jgi:hypothetical protein
MTVSLLTASGKNVLTLAILAALAGRTLKK